MKLGLLKLCSLGSLLCRRLRERGEARLHVFYIQVPSTDIHPEDSN